MKNVILIVMMSILMTGCGQLEGYYDSATRDKTTLYIESGDRNTNSPTNTDKAFIGDSITYSKMWSEEWPEQNVANYGYFGNTTSGVLANLSSYQTSTTFVILIGINDFYMSDSKVGFYERYQKIIDGVKEKSNEFYCGSILPLNHDVNYSIAPNIDKVDAELILQVNIGLEKLCNSNGGIYINSYVYMLQPGTLELNPAFTTDGLHLNALGYAQYVKVIKQYIKS